VLGQNCPDAFLVPIENIIDIVVMVDKFHDYSNSQLAGDAGINTKTYFGNLDGPKIFCSCYYCPVSYFPICNKWWKTRLFRILFRYYESDESDQGFGFAQFTQDQADDFDVFSFVVAADVPKNKREASSLSLRAVLGRTACPCISCDLLRGAWGADLPTSKAA